MMARRFWQLMAVGLLVVTGAAVRADDIGATPTRLTIFPRVSPLQPKYALLIKDSTAGIHKGVGVDPNDISAQLDIRYDAVSASFLMPAGASDGTSGWVKNGVTGAVYKNRNAGFGPNLSVKSAIIRPGKLVKVVMKDGGDVGYLSYISEAPGGPISICMTILNGGEQHRIGSLWPAGTCHFSQELDGFTYRLECGAGGQPDPTCSAAN